MGENRVSPTHEALEHERDAVLVVGRRHLVRGLERERRGVRGRDAEARPAQHPGVGELVAEGHDLGAPDAPLVRESDDRRLLRDAGRHHLDEDRSGDRHLRLVPAERARRGEHRVEVGVVDPCEQLRHRLAPRERVARRERALGPRPPVVVATLLVGRLAAEPQLELPGEADPGHLLPKPSHDPMCDVDGQRDVAHDGAGVEVEDRRAVRAEGRPGQAEVGRDLPNRSRRPRGDEDHVDAGVPRGGERGARSVRDGAVGAEQRPVEVDRGEPRRAGHGAVSVRATVRMSPGTGRIPAHASSSVTSTTAVPRRATIRPNPPLAARSAAATPRRDPSTRSAAVGVPPRCRWPSTVTRDSNPGELLEARGDERGDAAEPLEAERVDAERHGRPGGGSTPSATTTTE